MSKVLLLALLVLPLPTPALPASNAQWIALNRAGAPNSNLQCFTPNNVTISDGNLVITTKVENETCSSFDLPPTSYDYTSGFVAMRSFSFLYGTVEVRAKFGGGAGTGAWPAIWMADVSCQPSDPSGTDDHCNQQEIDIAEILKSDFTQVNQQIHVDGFTHNDGCTAPAKDTSQNFHVYQLDWSSGSLIYKLDGIATCTIRQRYVPNSPMYLKISMFAGKYGGSVNDHTLPWRMLVDYVKVSKGSVVVFNDDFNQGNTIQPAPLVVSGPPSGYHHTLTSIRKALLGVLIIFCLIAVAWAGFWGRNRQGRLAQ